MATATRIYLVHDTQTERKTLVRASTQAQAVRHVVKDRFNVAKADQETLVSLMEQGERVQDAGAEADEDQAELVL